MSFKPAIAAAKDPIRMARAIVPHLLEQGHGTIVNVGSVAGLVGTPYGGVYAASKHAVEALSEAMHFELSHRGIKVRVVEPGQFATDLNANSIHAAALAGSDELAVETIDAFCCILGTAAAMAGELAPEAVPFEVPQAGG